MSSLPIGLCSPEFLQQPEYLEFLQQPEYLEFLQQPEYLLPRDQKILGVRKNRSGWLLEKCLP